MVMNRSKKGLLLRILLFGCALFLTTFIIYIYLDGRNTVDAYYGACMLVSLQGQDDSVESDSAKILIGILAIMSGLVYAVSVWAYNERYLHSKDHYRNVRDAIMIGVLLWIVTFFIYFFVEERNFVGSFYGTCMLVSLQGQDDRPDTDTGKIFIGFLSIISSFLFGIMAWIVLEHYANRQLEINDFETISDKQLDAVRFDRLLYNETQV
jgi:hypothetical protein